MADSSPVLVLVRDLIFSSKIMATAKAVGTSAKVVREPAKLAGEAGRLLIVDLNLPGAIAASAAWAGGAAEKVVGFVSHVDSATIAEAREAGLSRILPRSRFVETLDELMAG